MTEAIKPNPAMSDYEAAAWQQLLDRVNKAEQRQRIKPVEKMNELAEAASEKVGEFLEDHQNLNKAAELFLKPLTGLQDLLTRAAASSVSERRILRKASRRDPLIKTMADLRRADLEVPDRMLSLHTVAYGVGLAAEGAATSLVITGFVVSSTVSGGVTLGAAAAAVSADVTANLAASSRLVADIAMSYGYDTRLPDEQIYALGVLSYGTTVTSGGKAASLAELSRLTQTMMRHAPHKELDKFVLVKVTREVLKRLGFKLSHERIAQVVPIVGAVVNAGTNAYGITRLSERAQDVYRLRFLTEKYELDAAAWLSQLNEADADADASEDVIDIEQLIREVEAEEKDNPQD